mgnify:CR=1 FL=1
MVNLYLGKISETAEKLESIMEQMRAETSNKVVTAWLQAAAIISQKVPKQGWLVREEYLTANQEIILIKSKKGSFRCSVRI